ncbi:MAG: hypothetical protein IT289_09510 [Oligoflexia bacterium]|nr:hypothetical protein [Oligoflexia bacterium]
MSVREELEKLSRLQEIDLRIDQANKIKNQAPNAFSELEKQIATESLQAQTLSNTKDELEKQKRSLETDMAMDSDRIKNIEGRLGAVSNNKEYHAASKEVDKAKKLISDRTKMVSDLSEKIAAQNQALSVVEAKIAELKTELEKRQAEVGSKVQEADNEIAKIAGDRTSAASQVNPSLISRYNRIRTRYSDALVAARGGHCTSCNVSLPPQMYIQVQKGLELVSCPSCQRLLYYSIQ